MSETSEKRTKKKFPIWLRVLSVAMAVVMALSLIATDAVRVKLRSDATTQTTTEAVDVLADSTEYVDEDISQRLSDWIDSIIQSPETLEDYYQIASILIAQGEYKRALVNIKSCIRLADGQDQSVFDELYMKEGCLEAMLGDYDAMRQSFQNISEESDYQPDALMIDAQAAIEENDAEAAVDALARYHALCPDETDITSLLGELYLAMEDYDSAVGIYDDLIARLSGTAQADAYLDRGTCYVALGQYEDALSDFTSALNAGHEDPGMCVAQSALACYLLGRYEDAITLGEQAVLLGSEQVAFGDLYFYMGVSALTLQRYEDGKTYFGKANELSTSMADCSYYYGVCCLATADYQTAIESFTASIEAGEALTLCYYNRGICYLQDADTYSLALADFGEVVSRGDDAELTESAELLIDQLTQALGEG